MVIHNSDPSKLDFVIESLSICQVIMIKQLKQASMLWHIGTGMSAFRPMSMSYLKMQ